MHHESQGPKTDAVATRDREQQEFCAKKIGGGANKKQIKGGEPPRLDDVEGDFKQNTGINLTQDSFLEYINQKYKEKITFEDWTAIGDTYEYKIVGSRYAQILVRKIGETEELRLYYIYE
jgi:hypothetical protein